MKYYFLAFLLLNLFLEASAVITGASLTFCAPSGNNFACQGTFNYTGYLAGETLTPAVFTAADGSYSPVNPFTLALKLNQVVVARSLGGSPSGFSYPDASLMSEGNCSINATSAVVLDTCYNYLGAYTMTNSTYTYATDQCGNVSNIYRPFLCPANARKSVYGLQPFGRGKMSVADTTVNSSFSTQVTYTTDLTLGSFSFDIALGKSDVARAVWVQGLTLPTISSAIYPFWFANSSGSLFVPNSKYVKTMNYDFRFYRDWLDYMTLTTPYDDFGMNSATASDKLLELRARARDFCSTFQIVCDPSGKLSTIKSLLITRDLMQALPDGYSSTSDSTFSYLSSNTSSDLVTVTVGFTALFQRLPPAIKLTSFVASSVSGFVAVYGVNSGNTGPVDFIIYYTVGPAMTQTFSIGKGDFTVRVDSSRVAKVCAGTSCLNITYDLGAVLNPTTAATAVVSSAVDWSDWRWILQFVAYLVVGVGTLVVVVTLVIFLRRRWRNRGKPDAAASKRLL